MSLLLQEGHLLGSSWFGLEKVAWASMVCHGVRGTGEQGRSRRRNQAGVDRTGSGDGGQVTVLRVGQGSPGFHSDVLSAMGMRVRGIQEPGVGVGQREAQSCAQQAGLPTDLYP